MRRTGSAALTLAALLLLLVAPHADAQQDARLSTYGTGEATVRPSRVTLITSVSGSAQLASDAIVKFRDAKRRATEAFEELAIEGLVLEGQGMALHSAYDQQTINMLQQRRWNPEVAATDIEVKPQIIVTEKIKIVINGIDKLGPAARRDVLVKLVETVGDTGLSVGGIDPAVMANYGYGNQPMSLFAFEVEDTDKALAEARAAAVADARQRAADMAQATGVQLGPIVSVNESVVSGSSHHYNPMQVFQMSGAMQMDASETGATPTDSMGPATVRVRVNLTFALQTP